jgi:hypothetical protein
MLPDELFVKCNVRPVPSCENYCRVRAVTRNFVETRYIVPWDIWVAVYTCDLIVGKLIALIDPLKIKQRLDLGRLSA